MKKKYALKSFVLIGVISLLMPTAFVNVKAANSGSSAGHSLDVEQNGQNSWSISNPYVGDADIVEDESESFMGEIVLDAMNSAIYQDVEQAVAALRETMILREDSAKAMCYAGDNPDITIPKEYLFMHLFAETANAKQGDYLYWNFVKADLAVDIVPLETTNYYKISLTNIAYRSSAAQELAVDTEVINLLSSTGAIGSKDLGNSYLKARAVYDYEIDTFDYVSGEDNHSTYSAMVNHKTVCQGYATTFYRLCRELGLSTRVVSSDTHGWNIVKLGNHYYHVDAVNGEDDVEQNFAKGVNSFAATHVMEDKYNTPEFTGSYPISADDYKYDAGTTEEAASSTEATEATTEKEVTTEAEVTTEKSSTESTGAENTANSTTEVDTTSEEPTTAIEGEVLYKDEYVFIYKDEEGAHKDEAYVQSGESSTTEWEEEVQKNPLYNIKSNEEAVHIGETSVNDDLPADSTEEDPNAFAIYVNGEPVSEELTYEGDVPITSIKITGLPDCIIEYCDGSGLGKVNQTVKSSTPLQAISIDSSKEISYVVKTAQLGWLDAACVKEMSGVLQTDDYLTGIKFSFRPIEHKEAYTSIVGACRNYVNFDKTPLQSIYHTSDAWCDKISNGGINDKDDAINAIRITSCNDITYKVMQKDSWLPEVTNQVLAGNPFEETPLQGLCINGDGIKYRIKDSNDTWSDWAEAGQELTVDTYIIDIQVYQE